MSSGGCPNFTAYDGTKPELQMLNRSQQGSAIFLYTITTLLALGGNSIVLFSIFNFHRLRTPTNLFIANLAIADILMATFCVPFSYWNTLVFQYWPFGSFLCTSIHFLQCLAVMLSSHTLIVICLDRFCAIVFTLRYMLTRQMALIGLVVVWAVDIAISLPIAVVQRIQASPDSPPNKTNDLCIEIWGSDLGAYLYSSTTMVIQYFFPIIFFILTYAGIGLKLWFSRVPSDSDKQIKTAKDRRDSAMKKLILMMLILCLVYTLCWLPLNIFNILTTRCESLVDYPYILYVWWFCHIVAMSHTFVNPIIYFATNSRFREGFKFAFTKCFPCCYCVDYNPKELYENCQYMNSHYQGSVMIRTSSRQPSKRSRSKSRLISAFSNSIGSLSSLKAPKGPYSTPSSPSKKHLQIDNVASVPLKVSSNRRPGEKGHVPKESRHQYQSIPSVTVNGTPVVAVELSTTKNGNFGKVSLSQTSDVMKDQKSVWIPQQMKKSRSYDNGRKESCSKTLIASI